MLSRPLQRFAHATALSFAFITGSCVAFPARADSFAYTGALQSYTVPAGTTSVKVKLWGAGGGFRTDNYSGDPMRAGGGAFVVGTLSVTPGEVLTIVVGQGGGSTAGSASVSAFGGGGTAEMSSGLGGGGGGGRSAILSGTSELVTAGAGGGTGLSFTLGKGGYGSTNIGGSGGGGGGSQSAGGYAGGANATEGSLHQGGNSNLADRDSGGGGGAGYYGGGGGGAGFGNSTGGGGGSSYFSDPRFTNGGSLGASAETPGGNTDGDYVSGVGVGAGYNISSGNGLVVIIPQTNQAPTANAGPDQTVQAPHDQNPITKFATVALDGTASSDPDGDTLSYSWTRDAYGLGSGAKLSVDLPVGKWTLTLTVDDGKGGISSDTVDITVLEEPNSGPTANAGPDQTLTAAGPVNVTLDASGSTDPDGDSLRYTWKEGSTELAYTQKPTVNLAVGKHTITLTVSDPYGYGSTDTVVITIGQNTAPVANAGPDKTIFSKFGLFVKLDGSGSFDPDIDSLTYIWKENGNLVGAAQTPYIFFDPGIHTLTLTVTDSHGASSTDTMVLTIDPRIVTNVGVSAVPVQRGIAKTFPVHLRVGAGELAGKTLLILVDNVQVGTAVTSWPTVGTFTYTAPATMPLGAHTLTVRFPGDASYSASEKSTTLTVKN